MLWTQDLLQSLADADNADQLFALVTQATKQLGFDFCSYGLRLPIPVSKPKILVLDNYPRGWMTHYQHSGYLQVDPTVVLGMTTNKLILWGDQTFAVAPELWQDARSIGLNVGIAQPAWGPQGSFGLLSLSRESERLSAAEVEEHRLQLLWIAQAAHASLHVFLSPSMIVAGAAALTARECEIIRWTADGKTAEEIASILGVSVRTITFHIQNVLVKLNSSNKIQATVKAVAMGLVQL
jgi:LuxR family quorum-sensing system transcriptional regulator SolR